MSTILATTKHARYVLGSLSAVLCRRQLTHLAGPAAARCGACRQTRVPRTPRLAPPGPARGRPRRGA